MDVRADGGSVDDDHSAGVAGIDRGDRGGQGRVLGQGPQRGDEGLQTRVVLPEPDTPATATNFPNGTSTSMFLRLCTRAPNTLIAVGTEGGFPAMRVRLRVLHADGDAPHHRGAEVLSPARAMSRGR